MRSVDAHFCEFVSKNPYGGKPNEKQGPKACQEDQRARKVQRKKCKGKESAVEYRFVAEYSFLAEWLWQMKINWAQDPFQILLYTDIYNKTQICHRIQIYRIIQFSSRMAPVDKDKLGPRPF